MFVVFFLQRQTTSLYIKYITIQHLFSVYSNQPLSVCSCFCCLLLIFVFFKTAWKKGILWLCLCDYKCFFTPVKSRIKERQKNFWWKATGNSDFHVCSSVKPTEDMLVCRYTDGIIVTFSWMHIAVVIRANMSSLFTELMTLTRA